MTEAPFIIFEKELIRTKYVENVITKKRLELSGNTKVLYKYMFDRYLFFKSIGSEFYDNQDDIADNIAMSKRFVVVTQKQLIDVGLIEKKTTRYSGASHSNSYVVQDVLDKGLFKLIPIQKVINSKPSGIVQDCSDFDDDEEF